MNLPKREANLNNVLNGNSAERAQPRQQYDSDSSSQYSSSPSLAGDNDDLADSDVDPVISAAQLQCARLRAQNEQLRARLETTLAENRELARLIAQESHHRHMAIHQQLPQIPRPATPDSDASIVHLEALLHSVRREEQNLLQELLNYIPQDLHDSDTDEASHSQYTRHHKRQRFRK